MKKTMRSILTLLLVLVMLFGVAAPTTLAATSADAPKESAPSSNTVTYDADWLEVIYGDGKLQLVLKPTASTVSSLSFSQLGDLVDVAIDAIYELVVEDIKNGVATGLYGDDVKNLTKDEIVDYAFDLYVGKNFAGADLNEKYQAFYNAAFADTEGVVISALADYVVDMISLTCRAGVYSKAKLLTSEEALVEIEAVLAEYGQHADPASFAANKGDYLTTIHNAYVAMLADIEADPTISGMEAISYLNTVTLTKGTESFLIMAPVDGEGVVFSRDGLVDFLGSVPTFSEIAATPDDEMLWTWDVEITASYQDTVTAPSTFTLEVSVGGDTEAEKADACKTVRDLAAKLDSHIVFSVDKNNLLTLYLTMPYKVDDIIRMAINTPDIPEKYKNQYYAFYTTPIATIIENLSALDAGTVISELSTINWEEMTSAIKDYIDLTQYSNQDIIDKLKAHSDEIMWAINLVIEVLKAIPENYQDNTILDLYNADGTFAYTGTHSLPIDTLFTAVSEKYGPLLAAFFGSDFDSIGLDLAITFQDSSRVRYFIDDSDVPAGEGFLPTGIAVDVFAPETDGNQKFLFWADKASGAPVTTVPADDIDLVAVYEKVDFEWSFDTVEYNGSVQKPVITNLPNGYNVTYTYTDSEGNVVDPVKAGVYTVTAEFTVDGAVVDLGDATHTFAITKKIIDLSGVTWTDGNLKFTGEEQSVSLVGLPSDVDVTYEGFSARIPGDYTATVVFTIDETNYEIVGFAASSYAWSIALGEIDISGVSVPEEYTALYTGQPISIPVSGLDTLPDFVTVTSPEKVNAGSYNVDITFNISGDDAAYYAPIAPITARLVITPNLNNNFTHSDAYGVVVSVDAETGVPFDYDFVVQDTSYAYTGFYLLDGTYGKVVSAYDIVFSKDGIQQSVDDNFTVKLRISESYLENESLQIVYVKRDGSTEQIPATVEDGYLVFEVDHFSTYAIVEITDAPVPPVEDEFPWWILIVIAIVLVIALIVLLVLLKRKKKDDGEPTEPAITEPTPEPEAEEPAEEPASEKPVSEPVASEPVAIEPAPERKPIIIRFAEDGEAGENLDDIDGEVVFVRFRTSFESRFIQAGQELQDYYTAIKNALMSYKGVKARTSWNFESFNKGRQQLAKLNIKGSSLLVYLALDPANYNAGKYHFTDASGKPKFADVPLLMKVKSDRALKYTLELIEEMMKNLGLEPGKEQSVDYSMPYETTEALAARGLVKIILPQGMILDENSNVVRVDVGELIGSHTPDEKTEVAEPTTVVVEEPAPVVEPIIEEPVVEPIAEPVPEPVEEVEDAEDEDEAFVAPADENDPDDYGRKYIYSYAAKLSLSTDAVKEYYSEIISFIKSYGIKVSRSWRYERVHKGRQLFALISFRGAKLVVALAKDPATADAKYHAIDVSGMKKYERCPMMLRITSDRKVKQAKELLLELFLAAGIKDKELAISEPRPERKSKARLIDEKLIKVIRDDRLVEEPVLEPVAEAPALAHEEFVVEGVIEHHVEPIAEELIVHVDAEHADEMLTNEEAENVIEIIHTGASKRKGKLAIINLDTICDNFEDHEVVCLETLKAKRLVPKNTARIKVLARGVMTKALTIVASKYSLSAVKMIYLAGGIADLED